MKGQTLKEALEYNPQPKKKFSTLSQEDRVKRLKQELADMEKLMRTGIGSSSLASGPSSAPADDEYVPQPPIPLPKKVKKPKKRERPPPPPPKKEMITLPLTSGIPPPPSGPPPKRVKEAKPEVDVKNQGVRVTSKRSYAREKALKNKIIPLMKFRLEN